MDEVYIQTILGNHFPMNEFDNHRFVEFIAQGRHAKILTLPEFQHLYYASRGTCSLFCIRKVSKALQWDVYAFLGEQGVVNIKQLDMVQPIPI